MISEVTKSKKVSKVLWAFAFFLIVAAFVIPQVDISLQQDSPRAQDITDPFAEPIHQFHLQYREQGLAAVDPQQAVDFAPMLKARSLADVGSVSAEEIAEIADLIEHHQHQIASQPDQVRRETFRNHRNEQILELAPRVDGERAIEAIDEIRADYIDELGVDPTYMSEVPDSPE